MKYTSTILGVLTGVLGIVALFLPFEHYYQHSPNDFLALLGNGPGGWRAAMISGSLFLAVPILIWYVLQLTNRVPGNGRVELKIAYLLGGAAMFPSVFYTAWAVFILWMWLGGVVALFVIPGMIALLNIVILRRNLTSGKNASATCGIFLMGAYASATMMAVLVAASLTWADPSRPRYDNLDIGGYVVLSACILAIVSAITANTISQSSEQTGRNKPVSEFIAWLVVALTCIVFFAPGNTRLDKNLEQQVATLGVESLVFISNGEQLATTNQHANVDLWHAKSGNHIARFYAAGSIVRALLHGPNDTIVGGDREGGIWIWGKSIRQERIGQSLVMHINSAGIALSSDKKVLLGPGDNLSVVATDLTTGQTLRTFNNAFRDEASWRYIAASENLLATASGSESREKQVNLYNINEGQLAFSILGYGPLAIAADQSYLACLTDHENLGVFDIPSGNERFRTAFTKNYFILSVALSPNNKWVAIGAGDNHARVLDTKSGEELFAFPHENFVESVAFSPDSKYLATGSRSGYVRIFDLDTGNITVGREVDR